MSQSYRQNRPQLHADSGCVGAKDERERSTGRVTFFTALMASTYAAIRLHIAAIRRHASFHDRGTSYGYGT